MKTTRSRSSRRLAAVLSLAALALTACGGTQADGGRADGGTGQAEGEGLTGEVRIDGSSTVAPFAEVAAELFEDANPGVRVVVATSGTGGGFEKFCRGETDISDASRSIKESEIELCEQNDVAYEQVTVALDGLVNVVSPEMDFVDCLTVEELESIWTPDGPVENWADVRDGFPDLPIELFGAGTDSGTFDYYTEAILGEEGRIRTDYNATEDDNVTVQGVSGTRGALGFFGLSYLNENRERLKGLAVDAGDGCVEPDVETVQSGEYTPLGRGLFMYPSDVALQRPEVVAFLDFVIANERQIAEEALFIPLTDEQLEDAEEKIDSLKG